MGKRVTFLLSKDPDHDHGGDIKLSRLVIDLAAQAFDVHAIALSAHTTASTGRVTRVAKPPVQLARLATSWVRARRSLVHTRFDVPALTTAIDADGAEVFVAEHNYMCESFLHSQPHADGVPLVLNTVNSESLVWKATRGRLARLDSARLRADELRTARAAVAVGTYDRDEAQEYADHGVRNAQWIDLTLAPEERVDVAASPQRLVFVGTRDWPPNEEAYHLLLRWWPEIAKGIPDAELCMVGAPPGRTSRSLLAGAREQPLPDGVRNLGFVDDLAGFLGTCRALVAPIQTGGGVRVKLLEAASRGLPVIGTSAALGSHGEMFRLAAYNSAPEFITQCRRYLLDKAAAVQSGKELYELNAMRWTEQRPHQAIHRLIATAG